jgi:hypothetical protein
MRTFTRRLTPLLLTLPLLLAGCAGTLQRVADCKLGDWVAIGQKDGEGGAAPDFGGRKQFCDNYENDKNRDASAALNYSTGWGQGNSKLWAEKGLAAGRQGAPLSQFELAAASDEVRKHKTPLNRGAYEDGWLRGNTLYWEGVGKRDGVAGGPLSFQTAAQHRATLEAIRFDGVAYGAGWQAGNRTFWEDAGFQDARNGVPDSALKARAESARAGGVQVQADAYRAAWNAELVNYWQNLGRLDAVTGKDLALRRAEAGRKGLKLLENDYRQSWERRLDEYWRQVGQQDGDGHPFALDARSANAARDGVFVIASTRAVYSQAWDAQNARYCSADNAFAIGRQNAPMALDVCRSELQGSLRNALAGGREYEHEAHRLRSLNSALDDQADQQRSVRRRLERLDQEIGRALNAKDRVVNEETQKQDKRRANERRELDETLRRGDAELDGLRFQAERVRRHMDHLKQDSYRN